MIWVQDRPNLVPVRQPSDTKYQQGVGGVETVGRLYSCQLIQGSQ